jgi:hypothetical protein
MKKPRAQRVHITQLSTGSLVIVEESTGLTVSRIGKTELTLVGAGSADDNYYDDETVTITYQSNDGVIHTAGMIFNTTTTTEVAFTNQGLNSLGVDETGTVVIDFYNLLTMVTSKVTQAGETIGIGSTGALTRGVIQAAATAAVAADIHGIGDVYVRGIDDTASLQSKATKLVYFTPWGEQKYAEASTVANATTEVRYFESTPDWVVTTVFVGDFYRPLTFWTETVPAGTKNMFLTDADTGNVDGSGGDIYGMIEEGIKEMLTSYFFAPPNRITFIGELGVDVPAAGANSITIEINYTPFGHDHPVKEQHHYAGGIGHEHGINLRVEPDTDLHLEIVDVANANTPSITVEYIYGQLTKRYEQIIVGAV